MKRRDYSTDGDVGRMKYVDKESNEGNVKMKMKMKIKVDRIKTLSILHPYRQ